MSNRQTGPASGVMSDRAKAYTIFILTIVYAFNFIDRQILVILQPLIKKDLLLSDTQLGLLTGISFALFYTILGIPIARLADKHNRRNIITIALTVWSGMTALSGMAQNYVQLLLARVGVGVGEAGGSPPAHSMISDMYEPKKRATALSVYSAGLYLGVVIGYIFGGYLGEKFGWRTTLLMVGLPGILLAIILYTTVREPVRGQYDKGVAKDAPDFRATLGYLRNLNSFSYIAFGCAMSAFVSYGTSNFMPSFLTRYHHFTLTEAGFLLALTGGFGGMIGTFLGGYLTDRYGKKDTRIYLWLPGFSSALSIPIALVMYLSENTMLMLVLYFFVAVLATFYLAPAIAVTHRLVAPRMRAMASAILFFVLNLIGLGLGPLVVGAISDLLRTLNGRESLREALIIGSLIAFVKVYLFWRGGQKLPEDIHALETIRGTRAE